jgi:acyl-coenzyme A synthetase/AMP-(fatty) acid ligase
MRFEHAKMVATANIAARKIRIIELKEEIQRCINDIEAQEKVILEQNKNIEIQKKAIEEKAK